MGIIHSSFFKPGIIITFILLFLTVIFQNFTNETQFSLNKYLSTIKCSTVDQKSNYLKNCRLVFDSTAIELPNGVVTTALRFTGSSQTRNERHQITWEVPVEKGVAYRFSVWGRISDRKCYIEKSTDPTLSWSQGRPAATRGVYCGRPKISVTTSGGTGLVLTRPINDYHYLSNKELPWDQHQITFRNDANSNRTTARITLELEGFDGKYLFASPEITKLESENAEQIAEQSGAIPFSAGFKFENVDNSSYLPIISNLKTTFQWAHSPDLKHDLLSVKHSEGKTPIVTLIFPPGTFSQSNYTSKFLKRSGSMLTDIIVSYSQVDFILQSDGILLIRAKNLTPQKKLRFFVRGRQNNSYTSFSAGVFFQASTNENSKGGFLFSPLYDRSQTSSLISTGIYSEDLISGLFSFDNSKFIEKIERPIYEQQINSFDILYNFQNEDRALLSVFPQRDNTPIYKSEYFPVAAFGATACDPSAPRSDNSIGKACQDEIKRLATRGVKTVFINGMRWMRSNQNQLYTFQMNQRTVDTTTESPKWILKESFIGIDTLADLNIDKNNLPNCFIPPSCQIKLSADNIEESMRSCQKDFNTPGMEFQICKSLISHPVDFGGPWAIDSIKLDMKVKSINTFKLFLSSIKDAGMKSVLYTTPQFSARSPDGFLQDIKNLHSSLSNSNGKPLFDGFYFDGLREGDPLGSLQIVRGTRNIIGQSGILILHLSSDMTFLSDNYNHRPVYLENYASFVATGEGNKQVWDLDRTENLRTIPVDTCPKNWGIMFAGKGLGSAGYLLFPEVRPVKRDTPSETLESISTLPARQIEAQGLCGGAIWAPANDIFSFIDKRNTSIIQQFAPNAKTNECGYWGVHSISSSTGKLTKTIGRMSKDSSNSISQFGFCP